MFRLFRSNWAYVVWFMFYFTLFWLICGANKISLIVVSSIYCAAILLSLSEAGEAFWRASYVVRPLRTNREKERLIPLFKEVYEHICSADKYFPTKINLYIQENMEINAYAYGRKTLVLTRGSIEMLNDDCLKGLMAHEFGHFYYRDPTIILILSVGNFFMFFLKKLFCGNGSGPQFQNEKLSLITFLFKSVYDFLYGIYMFFVSLGDVIITSVSREHEIDADWFAYVCGYGNELTEVLYELYSMTFSKPESIREQLRSTHPPITVRIEALENYRRESEQD